MERRLDDVVSMRNNILDGVIAAVQKKFPVENQKYIMRCVDLEYDTREPASLAAQKKAILNGTSLSHKLHGTWELVDKATGQVVDSQRKVVAHVPMATHRGTFIYNGSEYVVNNQLRLRPGPYTRFASTGEVETHVNLLPGTGQAFRVKLEPETGVFKLQTGQSNVPLYPIMQALGVKDEHMSKVWGPELLAANKAKQDKQALQKVYDRWVSKKVQGEDQAAAVWGQLNRMAVDDDIMEANLGRYMREVSDGSGGGAQPTPALPKPVANPGGLDPTGGDVPGMSGLLG